MKNINIPLEDKEFLQLNRLKGEMTWREFILQWIEPKKKEVKPNARTKHI